MHEFDTIHGIFGWLERSKIEHWLGHALDGTMDLLHDDIEILYLLNINLNFTSIEFEVGYATCALFLLSS